MAYPFNTPVAAHNLLYQERGEMGVGTTSMYPGWMQDLTGQGGLRKAVAAGTEFANWMKNTLLPALKEAGETAKLTGRNIEKGGYVLEEYMESEHLGYRTRGSLDIGHTGLQEILDVKVHTVRPRANAPEPEASKRQAWLKKAEHYRTQEAREQYARQQTIYGTSFENIYDLKMALGTSHLSDSAAEFLMEAFKDPNVSAVDIATEIMGKGPGAPNQQSGKVAGSWLTDAVGQATSKIDNAPPREVEVVPSPYLPEEVMRPALESVVTAEQVFEDALGMNRSRFGKLVNQPPPGADTKNWMDFIALAYDAAQEASAGAFSVGYAVNKINKAKSLIPGYNEGDPLHKFEDTVIQALGRTPSQAEGRAGMARAPELTDVGNFEPLDIDAYGPNVLYNPGSGDVSIVHHREGAKYPEEYWRGNIQLLGEGDGSRVVVDGRLIAPMQVRLGESDAPSPVFDNPETILSRTLHTASMLVQEQGGGIAAIKSVRKYMGDALGSHPMWTEGSTGYRQRLLETHILDPRFSPEQQRAAIPSHLAVMKGGTYAVDHMRWAQATAGTLQHQTGEISFGGSASKIRKRLQAASRGAESVLPMAWKETPRAGRQPTRELDWDRSRVMLSPLLQTVTDTSGRRVAREPEIGYTAKGAVTGHTILSEGTGMTSMESPMGQTRRHTLDIGGLVNFFPSESNYFDKEAGGFVLGWLDEEQTKPVVHKEAWDRYDVNPDSVKVEREAGRTYISYEGTGSILDSDSRLKNWLFTKAVWAKTGLSEMVPGVSDLDFLLQGFYSPTQAIYSTIAAEYKDRPHELAVAIYGKDAASYIVDEKPGWETTRKAQERLGKGTYQGVMMPTDPEHIKNYLGLGERLMTERMREKVEIEQPVSELELLGFQEAGIPHRRLGKRGKGEHATEWIALGVPALVADFFMQTGVEYPGQAQFSAEELMNLVRDPGEHGEAYKQAILKGVFPQLMQQSGHKRRLYQDILRGRFHGEVGSGIEIPEEEMIDFDHVAKLLGGTGKDAVEFMSKLKGLPSELQHKFIRVGNIVAPPIRTLEGLSVPDDPGKTMFWLNQEERDALAIKQTDVSQIINSLRSVMNFADARDSSEFGSAYARLERGLYHRSEDPREPSHGLASQAEVLRGALSAQVAGHEGMAISYPGMELGTVVMGNEKLMETFGTTDIPKIMEWLDKGQAVGLQRRPDIYAELTSFIPSKIVSVRDAREKYGLTNIPEDFQGIAYPSAVGAMALGDFGGDRIMSVLAAITSEVSGPQGKKGKEFTTDPAIMAAGSRSGLYARGGKAAAKMMGHESVATALQYGDDWDESMLTSEDVFDLNLMVGKTLSETAKQADTQKEEQLGYERVLGKTEKGTEGRRRGLVQWLVGNLDKVTPDQARDALQDIAHGQGTILGRAANRLWREVPAYLAAMGLTEQHGSAASRKALMGYQLSVDVENLSPGLLGYMNLMEGFTPGKTRGASYVKRLSPAEPGGALPTEQLKTIGGQGDFSVKLMQSILDANEFWEPAEGGDDWGVGGTKGQEQSNKLRAQAITADEGLQQSIFDVLQAGGNAQQIWDEVIGQGEDKFALSKKDLDSAMDARFGELWSNPGFLMGAAGASVAERMTRSGPRARRKILELNELTGGMWGEMAKAGTQMKASIDILSSRGGIDIIKQLGSMPNREGADVVFGNLLGWMGEGSLRNIKGPAWRGQNPRLTSPADVEVGMSIDSPYRNGCAIQR